MCRQEANRKNLQTHLTVLPRTRETRLRRVKRQSRQKKKKKEMARIYGAWCPVMVWRVSSLWLTVS